MKWCYFTTYPYSGVPADDPYNVPVPCDTKLYNLCPKDGTMYTLLEPITPPHTGYKNTADLLDFIATRVGWNPFGYDVFTINPEMELTEMFLDVGKPMMHDYVKWTGKTNMQYVNGLTDYMIVGYNYWNTSNPLGTCGFFDWPVPYFGSSTLSVYELNKPGIPEPEQHLKYDFTIYPEAMITGSKYNMDAMAHVEGEAASVKWDVYVHIDIWFDYELVNYNMKITMSASSRDYGAFYTATNNTKETDHVYDTNDPNNTDPNITDNGGDGDGDKDIGDPIIPPLLPDTDMTAAGSIRIYRMDNAMIKLLFDFLHTTDPAASILKWWQNPIQGMISLHYLPYPLQLKSSTLEYIKICGMESTIQAYPAEQFQTINFGNVYCGTNKNNYLDRSPYTRVQIYLPGIGIRDMNTDDVMGKYIWVQYNCDNVSGQCVAFVSTSNTASANDPTKTVKYSFAGSLAAPFPISQNNWGNTYIAAATLAAGALAAGVSTAANGAAAAAGGGKAAAAAGAGAEGSAIDIAAVSQGVANVGNSISQLAKPSVARSGTISGTTSLFSIRKPYIIVERPNVQDYAKFNQLKGYACGKTLNLNSLSGYTEVEKIHLTGIPATAPELSEIARLLREGVIL